MLNSATTKNLPSLEASRTLEASRILADLVAQEPEGQAELHIHTNGKHDTTVMVPLPALRLLSDALQEMAKGNAVAVRPTPQELTTQQAADLLQVSRPYVVKLLEQGKIPFRTVGHYRRVSYRGLLEYMEKEDARRDQIMRELVAETGR
jgi:excisionase family DNA binding protein